METISIQSKTKNGTVPRAVKLGRIRPAVLPKTLRLAHYFDAAEMATPPPAKVDYAKNAMESLQKMYANDQWGCCVISGKAHQVGLWSGNDDTASNQDPVIATDQEILAEYHGICGAGDNGCYITRVLDVMKSRGLKFGGKFHKIDGYVSVNHSNKLEVQVAMYLFGSLTLGLDLPQAWTCSDCTWDVTNSGIVGGHDVCTVGYDDKGVQISTWGGIVTITWAAFLSRKWITECYAQLAPSWYGADDLSPNGVNILKLKSDLDLIGGGTIPDPGPIPGPTPPLPPLPPVPPGPMPPTPIPQVFTVTIPEQHVQGGLFTGYSLPAFTVTGRMGEGDPSMSGTGRGVTIPPWMIPLLQMLCRSNLPLPQPWATLAQIACAFLPPAAEAKSPCGCQ